MFCDYIRRPELFHASEGYEDRHTDHGDRKVLYREAIAALCASRDRDELVAEMMAAGIPICPVYTPDEAVRSSAAEERDLIDWIEHPTQGRIAQLGHPLQATGLGDLHQRASPELGADTVDILLELGFDEATIAAVTSHQIK